MYHKSKWTITISDEEAARRLKGDAAKRYKQLQADLAKFNDIKPPERPVGQVMIDESKDAPKTFVLNAGAYDAPRDEVQPGFLTILDPILYTSCWFNTEMFGPGVFPPIPEGAQTRGGWKKNEVQSETVRRSVYTFVPRNTRYPMFEPFDMPDTHESCARRAVTVTPSQSLELLNNDLVLDWATAFAGRVLNDGGLTPAAQEDRAYKLAFSRTPDEAERKAALAFLDRQTPIVAARLAKNEPVPLPPNLPAGLDKARAAAIVDLCHMLFAANEFLYLD